MSTENSTAEQHRSKRTRRACLNCRRKKTRCPGELPACSFCVRLDQPCQYVESMQGKGRSVSRVLSSDKEDIPYSALVARVAQLEELVRMPVQPEIANSSQRPRSQHGPETLMSPNAWAFTGSPLVNASPPAGGASAGSLGDSESMFPLSASLVQLAVDAFFHYAHNQPYSFFCESRFRQRVIDGSIADHVLYAVVASAARFLEDRYSKSGLGAACAQLSWNLLSKHLHSDTEVDLSFVQATTLLALFDFTACKSRGAWKKIGTAARIAQDLKYMFEPDSSFPLQEQEEQRRTFWSIYMLDGLTTCGRARPPIFHGHYCKVNLPCTELSFQLGLYEETPNLDQAFPEVDLANRRIDVSPFARVILIATILSRASQYIMQDVNFRVEKPPWNSDSDYAVISSSLFNFDIQASMHRPLQEALDMDGVFTGEVITQSTEHIVFYYALYHLTQCMLNHHFLLRCRLRPYSSRVPPIFTSRAFETCRKHAQSLTALLDDAHRLGCRLRSSFLGYCALVAGTVNSLYQYDQDPNIRSQSKVALDKNIQFLGRHSQYWNNAKLMLEELRKFEEQASVFQSLIIPEIIELNFDPDTIERLYNLSDYNVVSRFHGNIDIATSASGDYEARRALDSLEVYPGEWMQSPSGHNSGLVDGNEIQGSQISGLPEHFGFYDSRSQTMVPEVGIRP